MINKIIAKMKCSSKHKRKSMQKNNIPQNNKVNQIKTIVHILNSISNNKFIKKKYN
jgi:hypothetical protein